MHEIPHATNIEAGYALAFSACSLTVLYLTFYTILVLWSLKLYSLGAGLAIVGAVFLIAEAINLRKPESERVLDERVERINEKAGFYAFWILISSLAAATVLSWYFELRLRDVLEYTFLAGMFSFVILRSYFSRRGLE